MRLAGLIILGTMLLAGCAQDKSAPGRGAAKPKAGATGASAAPPANNPAVIVTPGGVMKGKVASVRPGARFAVLSFPIGFMPAPERRLNIYRAGLKVGEVKITGPQRDNFTVADVVAGECQPGDEVRED